MGSKSQRKKEQARRKQQKKRLKTRRQQQEIRRTIETASGSNARHRQRLLQQTPKAWASEAPEDVAVFDDAALEGLPPELANQARAVREALQDALESRGDDAFKRTSIIPRSSPLADWRLYIRGLVGWLADDTQAAHEAWKRLDPERRPGRIATAMMTALRTDLEHVSPPQRSANAEDEAPTAWFNRCDEQLLYHARLLRRTRIDRPALRTAQAGLDVPEESKKLHLGPRKIRWLRQFIADHAATEPDLVAALSQAALGRAFAQNFSDVFGDAVRSFKGPRHDRRNLLLSFFYFRRFGGDRPAQDRAQRALDEYLKNDPIRKHLCAAVKAYPAGRPAYQAYVEWIQSKLDNERLTKPQRKPWEEELAEVMQRWSQGLPEDAEPRLWLVASRAGGAVEVATAGSDAPLPPQGLAARSPPAA
jgi:hypothetical protein